MSVKILSWDNTAVLANVNATGQRASKRVKAIGGAFQTSGFSPANDLLKTAVTTDATVIDNRVYEFKIEALCGIGGPVINNNGVKEGIIFACIAPSFSSDNSSVTAVINCLNTDITKARVILKKQSDNSVVGTLTVNNVANACTALFSGLDASTNYYVTVELYSLVDGVEVISSDAAYLNAVCGGNIAGYQVSTNASPACPAPASLVIS